VDNGQGNYAQGFVGAALYMGMQNLKGSQFWIAPPIPNPACVSASAAAVGSALAMARQIMTNPAAYSVPIVRAAGSITSGVSEIGALEFIGGLLAGMTFSEFLALASAAGIGIGLIIGLYVCFS
jgi:hypothetical protein